MRSVRPFLLTLAGGAAVFGLAQLASADVASDTLRSGGCSGCFNTQTTAAIAQFSVIREVVRACGTNGGFPDIDLCDGGTGSGGDLLDFVILRGDLRDKNNVANAGLGVPGGATNVAYRVSANGSSDGIRAGNNVNPEPIGFLSDEGFDGLSGTADDPTPTGGVGVDGVIGTADDTAPPKVACNTQVGDPTDEFPLPAGTVKDAAFTESCIVMFDRSGNGSIGNDRRGIVPGAQTTVGPAPAGTNETFNLSLDSDFGLADLPTKDFADPALSSQNFALDAGDNGVFGAQIFKMIASRDVHAVGDATKKVSLNDAQIEAMFAPAGGNSVCNWQDVGVDAGSTNDNLAVCIRAPGSGTKETFRNTFLANKGGDTSETTGSTSGTTTNCLQFLESGAARLSAKTAVQNGGNGDVITCVESRQGSIGYVDASDQPLGNQWYAVPVEGVDPDTNNLKTLVKCGHYRWWGPLSGGRANNPATSSRGNATINAFEAAHRDGLRNKILFASFESYLPLSGVGFTKNVTDGGYTLQFAPQGCPAQPTAPGLIP